MQTDPRWLIKRMSKKMFLIYLLNRALPNYENDNSEVLLVPGFDTPGNGLHSIRTEMPLITYRCKRSHDGQRN